MERQVGAAADGRREQERGQSHACNISWHGGIRTAEGAAKNVTNRLRIPQVTDRLHLDNVTDR
jgi:hypothetical protein